MPTYEYECKSCKHNFDVFQSMKDEPIKVCPECGKAVRRLINGGNGVIFKGNGFYVTDKGSGSTGAGSSGTSGSQKAEKNPSPCQTCPMSSSAKPGGADACPRAAGS